MIDIPALEIKSSELLIQLRWPACILSLLFVVFAASGLQHFKMDADPRNFFEDDNKYYLHFEALEKKYGRIDTATFALHIKEGTLYSKENLSILKTLTDEAWKIPYAQRVDSLANYTYSWSENDDLFVQELITDTEQLTPEEIERIKYIAHNDPDIVNRLTSTKGELAIVNVIAHLPAIDRVAEEAEAAHAAHALAKRLESEHPNIDIALTGYMISNTATIGRGMQDSATLIPLMYLIIFVLLFVFLRSFSAVFIIFLVTASATTAAMGIAFHTGMVLNMMSIAAINIIITVSIAHCVHLLHYFLEAYRTGTDKQQALLESLRINLQPIFLTSFTTILGFLSMNFSKMPPAHDLGNLSALGVTLAFCLSLTLLPALTLILPAKKNIRIKDQNYENYMSHFANFVINKRNMLLTACFLFSGVMLALVPLNEINDIFTENIKKPSEFREDNEKIDHYFGGIYTIEYDFQAAPGSTISDPEYLLALEKFTNYLRTHPNVRNVRSYSDIIKRLNKNMHGDDPAFYRIPDNLEESAQYLLLFELSQPQGADMSHYITSDKLGTKFVITTETLDSRSFKALGQGFDAWIKNNMPGYIHAEAGSIIYMWSHLGSSASASAMSGALVALLIISIILMLVFKSIRYGIISLIPNLLPAGIGYGIWALYSGMLQMSQMMVLSITIGIVVDDTIHFLSKYLRARRELNVNAQDAVRYAFKHVGAPIWITTAVLVCGFGLLIFSSFVPNAELGSLTAIILLAALALDFFMLPPLLMLADAKTLHKKSFDT